MLCLPVCICECVQEKDYSCVFVRKKSKKEDEGKLRDVKKQEQRERVREIRFRVSHVTLLPGSSDYICAITPSQCGLCWPQSPPRIPPMHSCSSCGSTPPLGCSLLPAHYHALRPLLLAPTFTVSLTCLGLGVIICPLLGGGKKERKGKQEKKKGGDCLENNCSLTPCSDSRGSALTRTAGIPSSINILFLRLPVKGHRGGVRRVFQHD